MAEKEYPVTPLKTAKEIKDWLKNEIRQVIKKHDTILDRTIYPNGADKNQFKSEEGQLLLYHIGVLSELLILIGDPD